MDLWIHKPRKDGKYPVTIGFDNGVRIKKIVTYEQLEDLKRKQKSEQQEETNGRYM